MSIGNYSDLLTAVANWIDAAGDTNLVARIPEAVQLLEGDLRRRLRNSVVRTSITLNAAAVAVPAAAAEVRELRLNTGVTSNDRPLTPRTPRQLNDLRSGVTPSGRPVFYTVLNREILLLPVPNQSYTGEIVYFSQYVPVSTSGTLIAQAPDLYLYGTLVHMAGYLEHDERIPLWERLYLKAVDDLNVQREREEFSQSLHARRLPRVF